MSNSSKIFYLCPDNTRPSWGLGIIYHHVRALRENGYEAYVVHEKAYFSVEWLNLDIPVLYWNQAPYIKDMDVLVVPEVMVHLNGLKALQCRKILFVQATSFLFDKLPQNETHLSLGFENAIGVMPHMIGIVEQFTGLTLSLIAPFIPIYFYQEQSKPQPRERIILIFPKFQQQDYGLIKRIINNKLQEQSTSRSPVKQGWKLVELADKSHRQVAGLMKRAMFFISTNLFESFNAAVVEAMAAGCINICYEGFGPRDYLVNNENAFVFNNNEAFKLCNHLFSMLEADHEDVLNKVRLRAFETAMQYSYENTRQQLLNYVEATLAQSNVA